eukprot:228157_1
MGSSSPAPAPTPPPTWGTYYEAGAQPIYDRNFPALNGPSIYFEISPTQFYVAVFIVLALVILNIFCLAMTHAKRCQAKKRKYLIGGLDSEDDTVERFRIP